MTEDERKLDATIGQWEYSRCYCSVGVGDRDWTCYGRSCSMCGNKNLRFIHVLRHLVDKPRWQIEVGIECAGVLVRAVDELLPRLAENETARKEKWRKRYKNFGLCVTTVADLENRGKL
jgi:hypothetical protein